MVTERNCPVKFDLCSLLSEDSVKDLRHCLEECGGDWDTFAHRIADAYYELMLEAAINQAQRLRETGDEATLTDLIWLIKLAAHTHLGEDETEEP